jgi:hypothetical protein
VWSNGTNVRLGKKRQDHFECALIAVSAKPKTDIRFIGPVKPTASIPKKNLGSLDKAKAGKDLAGIQQVNRDG